jgi:hypothetical protein
MGHMRWQMLAHRAAQALALLAAAGGSTAGSARGINSKQAVARPAGQRSAAKAALQDVQAAEQQMCTGNGITASCSEQQQQQQQARQQQARQQRQREETGVANGRTSPLHAVEATVRSLQPSVAPPPPHLPLDPGGLAGVDHLQHDA